VVIGADNRDTRVPIEVSLLPSLFEHARVGIISVDNAGNITAVNPYAALLTGEPKEDLLGRYVVDALNIQKNDGTFIPPHERPLMKALHHQRGADGEGDVLIRKDGTAVTIGWSCAPIMLSNTLTGAVLTFHKADARSDTTSLTEREAIDLRDSSFRMSLLTDAPACLPASSK
jgi:PAS domain S-box-containing protein